MHRPHLLAFLGWALAGCLVGGGGGIPAGPPVPATFAFLRLAAAPAKLWAAWSPLSHPGFDVHLPDRFVHHRKRLLELPGNGHPFAIELAFHPDIDEDGGYGRNWRSTLSGHLEELPGGDVAVRDHEGRDLRFVKKGADYDSPPGCWALLEAVAGGWRLTHGNRWSHVYDAAGVWTRIDRPDGGRLAIERNAEGCPTRVVTPEEREVTFAYDATHLRLVRMTDWAGRTWTFGYDTPGRLTECTEPGGARWTFGYDAAHRLLRVSSPLGELGRVTYDAGGGATRITTFDGSVTFAPRAGAVEATARSGDRWDFLLNAEGQLARRVAVDAAETEQYFYDALGRRVQEILPSGMQYLWAYVVSADPRDLCNVATYTHRPSDFPASPDHVWTYTWRPGTSDALTETTPGGWMTRWEYDAAGNVVRITPPAVKTDTGPVAAPTEYVYDSLNRQTEVRHRDGAVDTYEYVAVAPHDLVLRRTRDAGAGNDPKTGRPRVDDATVYEYDAVGRRTRETFSDGESVAYAYDDRDNLLGFTDEHGIVTTYTYDLQNHPATRSTPFRGRLGAPVGSGSALVETLYDRFGRLLEARRHDGFGTVCIDRMTYAGHPLPTRFVDGTGAVRTMDYDHHHRPVEAIDGVGTPAQRTSRFAWDGCGYLTSTENGEGGRVTSEYDGYGREIRVVDEAGVATEYEYDMADRIVGKTVRDALGQAVAVERFAFDDAGGVTAHEADRFVPGGPVVAVERTERCYDLRRRLVTELDARGARTIHCWDGASRLVRTDWPDLDKCQEYHYDGRDRLLRRRTLLGCSAPLPRVLESLFTYDAAGRATSIRNAEGNGYDYEHDSLGRVQRTVTAPDGAIADSLYDARGNLLALDKSDGAVTLTSDYVYDCMQRLTRAEEEDGRVMTYAYDALGRCTTASINGTVVTRYTYDRADRIRTRAYPGGSTITYSYDARGFVTQRTDGVTPQFIGVDALGNITSAQEGANTVTRTYDSRGNMLQDIQNAAGVTRSYQNGGTLGRLTLPNGFVYNLSNDTAGRVTSVGGILGGLVTYEYDPGTSLVRRQIHPSLTSEYEYDGLGRVTRAKNGTQSEWTAQWSRSGLPEQQERLDGSVSDRRVYDAFDRLLEHDSGSNATGFTTTFAYDATRSRLASFTTDLSTLQQASQTVLSYDELGRLFISNVPAGPRLYTYGPDFGATNSFENRPAYPAGEHLYALDGYGRVKEVRRRSDNGLIARYTYDPFNRVLRSSEEEFTGAQILERDRVFDGCSVVFEGPSVGFGGFRLYMVPDFARGGIGHVASGFAETAFSSDDLWERDCRHVPRQLFNLQTGGTQERYDNFSPEDTPHIEFPPGTPFRGPPSLQTAGLLPGFQSSYATGLQFHWSLPPSDPGFPRPLPLPGPPPPGANPLPRPQPFFPQPGRAGGLQLRGGGLGGGDHFACDDALAALCGTLGTLRVLEGEAWDCVEALGAARLRRRALRRSIAQWDAEWSELNRADVAAFLHQDDLRTVDAVIDGTLTVVTLGTEKLADFAVKKAVETAAQVGAKAGITASSGIKVEGSVLGELAIAATQLAGGFTFEGNRAEIQAELNIRSMRGRNARRQLREVEDELTWRLPLRKLDIRVRARNACALAEQQVKTAGAWHDMRKKRAELEDVKAELARLAGR